VTKFRSNPMWYSLASLCVLLAGVVPALGQANAPTPNAPIDPDVTYSGPSSDALQVDPINSLAYVNSNASSVQYTDRLHGPLSIAVEARGNYADNIFDAASGSTSGGYFSGGAPVGYRWTGVKTRFSVNYRIDGYIYPGYSQLNSVSQVYLHQLQYNKSEITNFFWNVAAGRVTSLGQYLPTLIPIGGTGITQPTLANNVLENSYTTTNAITAAGFIHKISDYTQMTGTVTGGWVEESENAPVQGQPRQILRTEPLGLDFQMDHLISPKTSIGGEVTNVYIRGLAPIGHSDYTAVQVTGKHNFTPNLGIHVAAGPLFAIVTQSAGNTTNDTTYAVTAAVDYTTLNARIYAGYSRVIALQIDGGPSVANQVSAVFDRSLSRGIDLTVDARFIHTDSSISSLVQTNYGITARVDRYLTKKLTLVFAAARFQQDTPAQSGVNFSYSRDQASVGVSYLFGNPLERQGVRK
jgi:hypothetical protein